MRDTIFISHANPEDNEFSRWLHLRLATEGYPVWCDLVKLRGGEDFWKDIEQAIRERTIKFLYVLSKTSNVKDGPLQELAVAKGVARREKLHDFIIPLHIDDLPYNETNIEINRLNAITFEQGWAKGLKVLLEKLEQDQVPKNPTYTPEIVASWWCEQFSADRGIINESEDHLSNWYSIEALPKELYFHLLHPLKTAEANIKNERLFPVSHFKNGVLTFAHRDDFKDEPIDGSFIADSHHFITQDLLDGKHAETFIDGKQTRNAVTLLLEVGWRRMIERHKLPIHEMSNKAWCFYFIKGRVDKDKLYFSGVNGKLAHRNIMGYRTMRTSDGGTRLRHWHFGISARPFLYPVAAFSIRPHAVFSDDGTHIWDSADRLHRACMSQCKDWWNDDWRDRILATMNWLAGEAGKITVQLGSDVGISVAKSPLEFTSPVSYIEPGVSSETDIEVEEVDEIEDEDSDEDE